MGRKLVLFLARLYDLVVLGGIIPTDISLDILSFVPDEHTPMTVNGHQYMTASTDDQYRFVCASFDEKVNARPNHVTSIGWDAGSLYLRLVGKLIKDAIALHFLVK